MFFHCVQQTTTFSKQHFLTFFIYIRLDESTHLMINKVVFLLNSSLGIMSTILAHLTSRSRSIGFRLESDPVSTCLSRGIYRDAHWLERCLDSSPLPGSGTVAWIATWTRRSLALTGFVTVAWIRHCCLDRCLDSTLLG